MRATGRLGLFRQTPPAIFPPILGLLGLIGLAAAFGWLAIAVMAVFAVRLRYLLAAGFSPIQAG